MQLKHNWIRWTNPQFASHPSRWEHLLSLQRQPTGLPVNLGTTIRELDRLQIFQRTRTLGVRLEKEITFDGHQHKATYEAVTLQLRPWR